jgi:hypothetical protein
MVEKLSDKLRQIRSRRGDRPMSPPAEAMARFAEQMIVPWRR